MNYNAYFLYGGAKFGVTVTSLKYSWLQKSKSGGQTKRGITLYPYRFEPSDLSVKLAFESPKRYRQFVSFIRQYHLSVTSTAGIVSPLIFCASEYMGEETGFTKGRGFYYEVALKNVPYKRTITDVAPTLGITLMILSNGETITSAGDGSSFSGTERDLVTVNNNLPKNVSTDSDFQGD